MNSPATSMSTCPVHCRRQLEALGRELVLAARHSEVHGAAHRAEGLVQVGDVLGEKQRMVWVTGPAVR